MKELLKYWEEYSYTGVFSFLIAIITLVVSIHRNKDNPKLRPLKVFLLAYIIDILFIFFSVGSRSLHTDAISYKNLTDKIILYIDFADTIIEFLAFFFLIKNHIANNKIKKALSPLLPVFLSLMFLYSIYYKTTHTHLDQDFLQTAFTFQAVLLLSASAFYYIDLFTNEPKLNLTAQPSFWVITGLTFFMLCTLPFSIVGQYLITVDITLYMQLFSIFDIFYCLLFLMIIKAYLCKPMEA